jgi:hypothetical protein
MLLAILLLNAARAAKELAQTKLIEARAVESEQPSS